MKRYDLNRLTGVFGHTGSAEPEPDGGKRRWWRKRSLRVTWPYLVIAGVAACLLITALAGRGAQPQSASFSQIGSAMGDAAPAMPTPAAAAPSALGMYNQSAAGNKTMSGSSEFDTASSAGTQPNSASSSTTGAPQSQATGWDRMIIRTATMQLTVKDVTSAVNSLISVATRYGGRLTQMNTNQSGEYSVSTITVQVPTEQFDKMVADIHKLDGQVKKIVSETISGQDVTDAYTDLQSQLRNLQATEARMLALQQKADTMDNILTIDRELRSIQGEIEQIQGRINYLSKSSEMSTVAVTLTPEAIATTPPPTPVNAWDPIQIAQQAWNASVDLMQKVASVVIAVAVFFWWAVPLLIIALWLAVRSRRRQATPAARGEGNA